MYIWEESLSGETAMLFYRTGMIILCACWMLGPLAQAGDGVMDAKRKAAADLMKEGKTAESIALIGEVIKADPENYKDHLLLARGYDKMNKTTDASEHYRQVLALIASNNIEDRASKVEAERRLKVLDLQMNKIQAAEDEFMKKLEQLEREAIAAKDTAAVRRIFRLKGAISMSVERADKGTVEIAAERAWQDSGFTCTRGRTYRIRAVGNFIVSPGVASTPDGTTAVAPNFQGPIGLLVGKVNDKLPLISIGSSCRFTARESGKLWLLINPIVAEKPLGSGSITVLIEQE
jgi:tetratricopeptide (TPR) repeat protein